MISSSLTRRAALRTLAAGALLPSMAALAPRAFAAGAPAPEAPLPSDSLWQLPVDLVDQDGHPFRLASLRGEPVLASMFYASCDMVCPLIFETISMTLKEAGAKCEARARVLLVTFDPARDTVEVLKQAATDHHAGPRWVVARGNDDAARQVAAVLGIQYKALPGGAFNHSSTIALLDAQGRVVERSARLGAADGVLVNGLRKLVA